MNPENNDLQIRLSAHPFLKGMDANQIRLLADRALPTHFKAGEIIFRAGETANHFYLIESGTVAIEGGATSSGVPAQVDRSRTRAA